MNIQLFTVGPLRTNCYLLSSDNNAVIIDPGISCRYEFDDILNYIHENSLSVRAVLITHSHIDHIMGVDTISKHFHCPVYISSDDKNNFYNPDMNLSRAITKKPFVPDCDVMTFNDGDILNIYGIRLKCVMTPGHTQGSACFFTDDTIFTGDTVFSLSAGRCDFPGGSDIQIKKSIKKIKILISDNNYRILPGHGPETTADFELKNNEYFK